MDVRYRVICDAAWATRSAELDVRRPDSTERLEIIVSGDGWLVNAEPRTDLDGCVDVDIALGASTNTLPIRRVPLAIDQAVEIKAAWVLLPDLEVQVLPQRYTRLAHDRYRYESLDSGFTAELEVDDLALVVTYPGWCERVAAFDPPAPSDPQTNR
jgi:hypothetical protein